MKPKPALRRHGIGATKRRAIVILFAAGFDHRDVARQLGISVEDVLRVLRQSVR